VGEEAVGNPSWKDFEWDDPGRKWSVWDEYFATIKYSWPGSDTVVWENLENVTFEYMRCMNIAVRSLPNITPVQDFVESYLANTRHALMDCSPNFLTDTIDVWVEQNSAAFVIQHQWRQSIANPKYRLCRMRLQTEFAKLQDE
jgi:hypothetical protein